MEKETQEWMDTVFSTQVPCIMAAEWAQIQSHRGSALRQRQGSQCLLSALRCLSQPRHHTWWEVRPHVMRGKRMSALGWKRCTSRVGGPAGIPGKDILFGDCSRHSRELALLNSQHFTSFIVKTGITILYMTGLLMKCETIFKQLACNSHAINRWSYPS